MPSGGEGVIDTFHKFNVASLINEFNEGVSARLCFIADHSRIAFYVISRDLCSRYDTLIGHTQNIPEIRGISKESRTTLKRSETMSKSCVSRIVVFLNKFSVINF